MRITWVGGVIVALLVFVLISVSVYIVLNKGIEEKYKQGYFAVVFLIFVLTVLFSFI